MKALSIRQPWAWLICAGYKDVENRSWPTEFTGRIYVHASKTQDDYDGMKGEIQAIVYRQTGKPLSGGFFYNMTKGAVIGEVDITGHIIGIVGSPSPWYDNTDGMYGFTLSNPKLYRYPVECRGQLGFFNLPDSVISALKEYNI